MNKVISQDEWRVLWRKWNTVIRREAPLESAGWAIPLAGSTELRLQDALQTHELLKPDWLRLPLFLTALPPGLQFLLSELPFVFLQTVPVQSKRYHLSLSAQRAILQLHSQGKTDFLEEKEEDRECCGWLRAARYWEFPGSCLEIWGQREPLNAVLSSVWLYLGSILKKFYQLVGSYIWYKNVSNYLSSSGILG